MKNTKVHELLFNYILQMGQTQSASNPVVATSAEENPAVAESDANSSTLVVLTWYGRSDCTFLIPNDEITPDQRDAFEFADDVGWDESEVVLNDEESLALFRQACLFFGDPDACGEGVEDAKLNDKYNLLSQLPCSTKITNFYAWSLVGGHFKELA
jgi:hypothetical protein